jgi:hypothetical protein
LWPMLRILDWPSDNRSNYGPRHSSTANGQLSPTWLKSATWSKCSSQLREGGCMMRTFERPRK